MSPKGTDYIFILVLELRSEIDIRRLLIESLHLRPPGARRVVSEGSTGSVRDLTGDFPADCPHHLTHCHRILPVAQDTLRGFQHIAKFFSRCYQRGSQLAYDFTPIADPTFDGSLLAVGPPASGVASFRGVTGGDCDALEPGSRSHRTSTSSASGESDTCGVPVSFFTSSVTGYYDSADFL